MRIIEKEQVTTNKYNVYVAKDGSEFFDKEQCEKWEKSLDCTIRAAYHKIPKTEINYKDLFWSGSCDDYLVIYKPRNIDDIKILNMYCGFKDNDCLTQDDIGKEIAVDECCGDFYRHKCKNAFSTIINMINKQKERAKDDINNYGYFEINYSCGNKSDQKNGYSLYDLMNSVRNKVRSWMAQSEVNKDKVNISITKDGEFYSKVTYCVEYDKAIGHNSFKFEKEVE